MTPVKEMAAAAFGIRMPAEPSIRRHLRRGRAHRTQGARTHADAELAATSDRAVPARQSAGRTDLVQAQRDAAAQHRHRIPAQRRCGHFHHGDAREVQEPPARSALLGAGLARRLVVGLPRVRGQGRARPLRKRRPPRRCASLAATSSAPPRDVGARTGNSTTGSRRPTSASRWWCGPTTFMARRWPGCGRPWGSNRVLR